MPPVGFELTISAGERPRTYTLDRAATGTGVIYKLQIWIRWRFIKKPSTSFCLQMYYLITFTAEAQTRIMQRIWEQKNSCFLAWNVTGKDSGLDASCPSLFQVNQEITGTALSQMPFCLAPNTSFAIPDLPIDVICIHVWHTTYSRESDVK